MENEVWTVLATYNSNILSDDVPYNYQVWSEHGNLLFTTEDFRRFYNNILATCNSNFPLEDTQHDY